MVATPSGDRAIETLKIGDVVWTKPEHGGKPFAAAILKTHQRNDQPIYKLTLESTRTDGDVKQETLFVTPSHPFYVPAQRDFVPMIELKTGDLLQSLGDGEGEGTSSRVASVELYKPVGETFNLTVDIGHTFYVGELKTWVHNEGPCDIEGGPKQEGNSPAKDNEGAGTKGSDRGPVDNPTPAQLATAEKLGVDPRWVKPDGSPDWPTKENNGFDGGFDGLPKVTELKPGQTFDRYGGRYDEKDNFTDYGKFVAPTDVPFDQRALPDSSLKSPYRKYEVIKPIPEVNSGNAASWFGKPGGGTQYQLPMSIDDLIKQGFIKEVK